MAPLVDAGLLSCLVAVLYRFLSPPNSSGGSSEPPSESTGRKSKASNAEGLEGLAKRVDDRRRRLSVEGSIVHIMKALAQHPSAAHSLVEDHSLQLLVCMVAVDMAGKGEAEMGKEDVGSPMRGERITPQLHKAQLRRHAMQVGGKSLKSFLDMVADCAGSRREMNLDMGWLRRRQFGASKSTEYLVGIGSSCSSLDGPYLEEYLQWLGQSAIPPVAFHSPRSLAAASKFLGLSLPLNPAS